VASENLGVGKTLAAAQGAWICFADEAGQTLQPPKARTGARRGQTPVLRTSSRGAGRISLAGLLCLRLGHRGRFVYRSRA
jgi:putative transposase